MIFLISLIITIETAFVGSVIELIKHDPSQNKVMYTILPDSIVTNNTVYLTSLWLTAIITGLFSLPNLLLFYI